MEVSPWKTSFPFASPLSNATERKKRRYHFICLGMTAIPRREMRKRLPPTPMRTGEKMSAQKGQDTP